MFSFQNVKDESSFVVHFLQSEPVFLVQILVDQIDTLAILILEAKPLLLLKEK